MATTKKSKKSFIVYSRIELDIERNIFAETLEEALKLAREQKTDDHISFKAGVYLNGAEIEVQGVMGND